jgi:hypothetical protein
MYAVCHYWKELLEGTRTPGNLERGCCDQLLTNKGRSFLKLNSKDRPTTVTSLCDSSFSFLSLFFSLLLQN